MDENTTSAYHVSMKHFSQFNSWTLDIIGCSQIHCHGRLHRDTISTSGPNDILFGLVRCDNCDALYPILAGILVIVPDVPSWMAAHKDSIIATLATQGAITPDILHLIDEFSTMSPPIAQTPFDDDWVSCEADPHSPNLHPNSSFLPSEFITFLSNSARHSVHEQLAELSPRTNMSTCVEIGCGAGLLSKLLLPHANRLVVGDYSLRAVCNVLRQVNNNHLETLSPVVMDAEQWPIIPGSVDNLFAAHLIDLLHSPQQFIIDCNTALRSDGHLFLSTPAPDLGTQEDDALSNQLTNSNFRVSTTDPVPWVRIHSHRHFQIYFSSLYKAQKTAGISDC